MCVRSIAKRKKGNFTTHFLRRQKTGKRERRGERERERLCDLHNDIVQKLIRQIFLHAAGKVDWKLLYIGIIVSRPLFALISKTAADYLARKLDIVFIESRNRSTNKWSTNCFINSYIPGFRFYLY